MTLTSSWFPVFHAPREDQPLCSMVTLCLLIASGTWQVSETQRGPWYLLPVSAGSRCRPARAANSSQRQERSDKDLKDELLCFWGEHAFSAARFRIHFVLDTA